MFSKEKWEKERLKKLNKTNGYMKTKALLLLAVGTLLLMNSCYPFQKIKGDGNVVTEVINIGDYDALQAGNSSMKIEYRQSDEAPSLTITTDQNILEMYDIRTEGNSLKILPKPEHKQTGFFPTEFTVITNSTKLKKVDVAGSVDFYLNSPLKTDVLDIDLAGSGTVNLNDSVFLNKIDVDLAGSATINAPALFGNEFDGDIAGSGKLNLGGVLQKASFEIAGSGTVRAFDLQVEDMSCDIAGSGDIEISVSNSIRADVAGSGRIKYKGDPQDIRKSIAGSGSIKKVD